MSRSGRQQATQGEISHAPTHTLTARSGVFFLHHPSRTARRIVGVSAASQNQEAKEKPPLHGDPAPRMKHFSPLHADPAPRMKHFPPLHSMDRAIMKFSSPTHTQNAQFPTIFSVLGRYFFHRGTPHNHTVLRRGDLSFMQPPGAPPAWRTPEKPSPPRDAEPNRGAGGWRQGQASEKSHAIRLKEGSTTSENVGIPMLRIQGLKEL